MQEGSPADPSAASEATAATETTEPTEGEVEEVTSEARTPEEVEAIWRNRVAGKDRAHAAEAAELRRQIEALNQRITAGQSQSGQVTDPDDASQWKAKAEAAEQALREKEAAHAVEVRLAKYPAAAEVLSESALAAEDEAKLAALNARLSEESAAPPPVMDPNAPRRPSQTPSTPRDKGVDELESDLKKFEPEFLGSLNQ